jgi:pumilio family protein 6
MPSATTTKPEKPAMGFAKTTGSKRKEYPVREKHSSDRDNKKVKTTKPTTDTKILKSALRTDNPKAAKAAKQNMAVKPSADSENSDSDGGAALDSEDEDVVTPADGLHPDRLKAVITSSKHFRNHWCSATAHVVRSIVERSTCEAKATRQGEKSCEAYG